LTEDSLFEKLTQLFLDSIHEDYPSHGDIMDGRAESPGMWAGDLSEVFLRELAQVQLRDDIFAAPGIRIAIIESDGKLVGFAGVVRVSLDVGRTEPIQYARLDDIVVAQEAQGQGVGSDLVRWVERELRAAGVTRIFLESGINNRGAHHFFQELGYDITSVTFLKDLGD